MMVFFEGLLSHTSLYLITFWGDVSTPERQVDVCCASYAILESSSELTLLQRSS